MNAKPQRQKIERSNAEIAKSGGDKETAGRRIGKRTAEVAGNGWPRRGPHVDVPIHQKRPHRQLQPGQVRHGGRIEMHG